MITKAILTTALLLIIASNSVSTPASEPYLTETQRVGGSDAVFDGLVEQVTKVGVIDMYQTLWEATVLLKTVVKGKSLRQVSRVKVYYTGSNGNWMIACPSPPHIERNMKARFYAKRQNILEFKRVLFIQSGQWIVRKDAI